MHEFGTTRKQLAAVAVKNHANGAKNPKAQFRREMTLEQVLEAPPVSSPLGMFDCAPLSDGAAAVVLAPLERAWSYTSKPIRIAGTGQATDTLALHSRKSITSYPATKSAATMAYRMAGIGPGDVAFAEVNDDFTISELLAIEDLGFVDKGKSGEVTEYGTTGLGGDRPINTSGGLKARGHPLGATGVAQFYEVVAQLRGAATGRQVKNARYGVAHNVGGTGSTAVVHVLEAVT
jgi:acetyl-CoA C-acetyltransferase